MTTYGAGSVLCMRMIASLTDLSVVGMGMTRILMCHIQFSGVYMCVHLFMRVCVCVCMYVCVCKCVILSSLSCLRDHPDGDFL